MEGTKKVGGPRKVAGYLRQQISKLETARNRLWKEISGEASFRPSRPATGCRTMKMVIPKYIWGELKNCQRG
jgi:hypothetical protein